MAFEKRRIPRIMITATGSGSGKTTFTCGLLQALLDRGEKLVSYKCGPDYIDPMFHTEVLGLKSRNLDLFFVNEDTAKYLLCKNTQKGYTAVLEGVMGYYDGLAGISTEASSYHLSKVTDTPAVLLIDCKGKSLSILAEIKGFLEFKVDNKIQGIILNRFPEALYEDFKEMIENQLGIRVYGYLPIMKTCTLESRHLGLVTAKEVGNLREIISKLAVQIEKTVDIQGLIDLANSAIEIDSLEPTFLGELNSRRMTGSCVKPEGGGNHEKVRIAVAHDKAFCFYYEDNLDLLRELGAEIVEFSPLEDENLPRNIDGIIFGGGYPELYLELLSKNTTMRNEIKRVAQSGMPIWAECGGFMYLHKWIEDQQGNKYPMAGIIEATSFPTGKLGRFGYITLTAQKDNLFCSAGEKIRGHEFHYWDSTYTGEAFLAEKPLRNRKWECIIAENNLFVGYPHIHFYSNPSAAKHFINTCKKNQKK